MTRAIKVVVILLALTAIFVVKSLAVRSQVQEPVQEEFSPAQIARAKSIFKDRCARCHGVDGRGETTLGQMLDPPDFTEEKWSKPDPSNDELASAIRAGKGEMPAFGKKLTRQEISYLIAYIRRFSKPADKPQ